jgi:hypothetical protein
MVDERPTYVADVAKRLEELECGYAPRLEANIHHMMMHVPCSFAMEHPVRLRKLARQRRLIMSLHELQCWARYEEPAEDFIVQRLVDISDEYLSGALPMPQAAKEVA